MHSSITITDGIYGNLTGGDFFNTMAELGNPPHSENPDSSTIGGDIIRALIKLQENPKLLKMILKA